MAKWFQSRSAIFLLALLLRLGLSWNVLSTTPLKDFWRVSEPATVAESLLAGRGFTSPYDTRQPSAWIAPIYPALIVAPAFRLFGAYSLLATYFLVVLNAVFAAIAALVIVSLGEKTFGRATGLTAGWLWATCVPSAVVPLLVWDTSLSALVLAVGVLLTLTLNERPASDFRWGATGCWWGFACLVNPALITPVPFLALFPLDARTANRRTFVTTHRPFGCAVTCGCFAVACTELPGVWDARFCEKQLQR